MEFWHGIWEKDPGVTNTEDKYQVDRMIYEGARISQKTTNSLGL
jgi:hypothetical protein